MKRTPKRLPLALQIRALIFLLYLIFFTIPYGVFCLLIFPCLNTERRYACAAAWCHATLWILRTVCGITHQVKGWEYLPNGPAVLLSKHQSAWEILGLITLMPRRLCFVFKRELLRVPFFGWVLGLLRMIRIDRCKGHDAFTSILRQGRARLQEGAWIVMFPEGTRTRVGAQGPYKTGGARFAVQAGVPVIPIAHNAGYVWPRNSFTKYPGTVTVSIGPAIPTASLSPQQVNARVEEWIEMEMRRIDAGAD
ncbi:lysophospholipid acyltransferase family protein [Candidatus Glomeribacter gigasporarum]|nr:lysophospholipid acyltransferase family protein [Candidatus Glomeribacter gigasporarum]